MSMDEALFAELGGRNPAVLTNQPISGLTFVGAGVRLVLPARTLVRIVPGTGLEADIEGNRHDSLAPYWTTP